MTICIAALYDNGKGCVLASDQMTTAHVPMGYEFESDEVEKAIWITDSACALISGDVLFANQVIEEARKAIGKDTDKRAGELVEAVRESYRRVRTIHLVRTILEPRGLSLDTYYKVQKGLSPTIAQMIDAKFSQQNLGIELIVAGKDSLGCHIYSIQHPGVSFCHDPIGFVTIGTGAAYAFFSLIESEYKKSLPQDKVEELVGQAKRRSEVAPGVGEKTTRSSL